MERGKGKADEYIGEGDREKKKTDKNFHLACNRHARADFERDAFCSCIRLTKVAGDVTIAAASDDARRIAP